LSAVIVQIYYMFVICYNTAQHNNMLHKTEDYTDLWNRSPLIQLLIHIVISIQHPYLHGTQCTLTCGIGNHSCEYISCSDLSHNLRYCIVTQCTLTCHTQLQWQVIHYYTDITVSTLSCYIMLHWHTTHQTTDSYSCALTLTHSILNQQRCTSSWFAAMPQCIQYHSLNSLNEATNIPQSGVTKS